MYQRPTYQRVPTSQILRELYRELEEMQDWEEREIARSLSDEYGSTDYEWDRDYLMTNTLRFNR